MKSRRLSHLFLKIVICFVRMPWLLAVVYFFVELLFYLSLAVLFVNHCPACNRFVPEMSDEFAANICDVYEFLMKLTVIVGGGMLFAPLMPLFYRRYRTSMIMLILGSATLVIGTKGVDLVPWSCRSVLAEQMRVVRLNLERKKSAAQNGRTNYVRVPVHKFIQRQWMFYDERYVIYQLDNTIKPDVYFLSDRKWRQDRYRKDCWENRVLLDDVIQWNDCRDYLSVITKSGNRYILDYASGKLNSFMQGGRK